MLPRTAALSLFMITASVQAKPHTALVHHSPQQVVAWAVDGLQQMGYTIRSSDTTAGVVVADRVGRVDPDVGTRYDELDVKVSAHTNDTTQVEISTVSWTRFNRASRRNRDKTPSASVEDDAARLLDALK
jgi:hypothetical protein